MKSYRKRDFPLTKIRRFLEPGPIVLVSSAWKGKANIMTMGWHMMLGFSPALFGGYIWAGNHSFEMIRRSKACVINLPTTDLANEVVGIGNCSGDKIDKFKKFKLTPVGADKVSAPLSELNGFEWIGSSCPFVGFCRMMLIGIDGELRVVE